MYDITKLTNEQILAIKNEDRQKYFDFAYMTESLIPVDCPTKQAEKIKINKTIKAFKVGDCVFLDLESAQKFNELSSYRADYDYQIGYEKYFLKKNNYEIIAGSYYDEQDILKNKEALRIDKENLDAYNKQLELYNKYLKQKMDIDKDVQSFFDRAENYSKKMKEIETTYLSNVELCNGDKDIAMNFLEKQFKDDVECLNAFKLKRA